MTTIKKNGIETECEVTICNSFVEIDGEEINLTESEGAEYLYLYGDMLGEYYSEVREDDNGNKYTIIFEVWEDAGEEDGEHPEPEDCCDWENPVKIIIEMAEEE